VEAVVKRYGRLVGADGLATLQMALEDRDWMVRLAAVEILGELGPKARPAVPALKRLVKHIFVGEFAKAALKKIEP
jgi:hypothetical protein